MRNRTKNQPPTGKRLPDDQQSNSKEHLSALQEEFYLLSDVIIQTDLEFRITGWNESAEKLYGLPSALGKELFRIIKLEFTEGSIGELKGALQETGKWAGEVLYTRFDGVQVYFRSTANYIRDKKSDPISVIIVSRNITKEKLAEKRLADSEASYEALVNTLMDGVLILGADGKITACNKRAPEILGVTEEDLMGKVPVSHSWKVVKSDGRDFPDNELPPTVTLQTGFPQRNVKLKIVRPDESFVWLSVSSQALIRAGEFEPYTVVVSFSDITDSVQNEQALQKSNERFFYTSKVTSDAIWDIDLETNEIYRSETFNHLSGYSACQTEATMDWWFNKIHPEERNRVRNKVNEYLKKGLERWEDEYRFECADGSYKYFLDTGSILYKNDKPVRIIGAICDLTEKKKLEEELLNEQQQKHKAISQASISAQEKERNNISKELHDNVNQILMSAKLCMISVKDDPVHSKDLLNQAIEYQTQAFEEIRKLSKSLNSSIVKLSGLKKSIGDILSTINRLRGISVKFNFESKLDRTLSDDQKLMIFRIVQEQSNNIIKYAEATEVTLCVREEEGTVFLFISDNGKGFDTEKHTSGIGFINIYNRVDAFNGKVKLISTPGGGCTLEVQFPLF